MCNKKKLFESLIYTVARHIQVKFETGRENVYGSYEIYL